MESYPCFANLYLQAEGLIFQTQNHLFEFITRTHRIMLLNSFHSEGIQSQFLKTFGK